MAKYQLTEEEKIKEQQAAEKWAENMDSGNVDQEYWDKLLRHHYEQHVEEESGKMGKGQYLILNLKLNFRLFPSFSFIWY